MGKITVPLFPRKGLRQDDLLKLRERFDSILRSAGKNPEDFDAYYKKEEENIAIQVHEMFPANALEKAFEMIETSAKFELIRKDVVKGLLDGTL